MIRKFLFFVCLTILILGIQGCRSQVPKPTAYEFSTQQKMQAAHHWDILANDVAKQITLDLDKKLKYQGIPLYIKDNQNLPFTNAFFDLLGGHLLDKGMEISQDKSGSILVDYNVQVIHHKADRSQRPWPGTMTATASVISGGIAVARNISGGVAYGSAAAGGGILLGAALDAAYGYHVSLPKNEVLITTALKYDRKIIMKKTDIYYINDADFWHYCKDKKARTYTISN